MANSRGRQAIGVNQPPSSGSRYPFVQPATAIQGLLSDFFVSFDDLNENLKYPFHVVRLYGFGDVEVSPIPDWPVVHSHDVMIVDDIGQIVFDSTTAETFTDSSWDDRLLILEWTAHDRVCRCVKHTEWTAEDIASGRAKSYNNYIELSLSLGEGELQADCWYRLPKRVTSIRVALTTIEKTSVILAEGFNLSLFQELEEELPALLPVSDQKPVVPGVRAVNRIRLDATPGNGKGTFPGCVSQEVLLRTINRIKGNSHQNFTYDTEGCIRIQRPVSVTSAFPRTLTYAASAISDLQANSAIRLSNDCINCCDCTYFAQTYQGLKRQWFFYRDVAKLAEETRDVYADNRDRWLAEKTIRESEKLRLRVSMDGDGKVSWGVAFCNASKCHLSGIKFYLFFLPYINGIFSDPEKSLFMCGASFVEGSAQCNGPEPILAIQTPEVSNSFSYVLDSAAPQSQTLLYGRVCLPDAKDLSAGSFKVRVWVGVEYQNILPDPATGNPCVIDVVNLADIPPEVQQIWGDSSFPSPIVIYGQQISPLLIVEKNNPFCSRCECESPAGPQDSQDSQDSQEL